MLALIPARHCSVTKRLEQTYSEQDITAMKKLEELPLLTSCNLGLTVMNSLRMNEIDEQEHSNVSL